MSSFPRSLYASLLLAVLALQMSSLVRGLEQRVCGFVVLPLRAYATLQSPAHASEAIDPSVDNERLVSALWQRLEQTACDLPAPLAREGFEPVVCHATAFEQGKGKQGKSLLVLDRTRAGLRGCEEFVTYGQQLVGFFAPGPEAEPAAVELLDHVPQRGSPRRLLCTIEILDSGGGRGAKSLRCLVEPAPRSLGQSLQRCSLVDDPYLAAKITTSGGLVRTMAREGSESSPWPGLLVGNLRVRGYELAGQAVPIGLFACPTVQAPAISVVAAWRRRATLPTGGPDVSSPSLDPVRSCLAHRVRVLELCVPPPARQRWFLAAAGGLRLPRGAALLEHGALAGTVLGSGSGYAIGAPFGEAGDWALVVLPRDRAPIELVARAVGREEGHASLVLGEDPRVDLNEGVLMTGPNGLDCPAGIPIGVIVGFERPERRLRVRLYAGGSGMEAAVALARPRREP